MEQDHSHTEEGSGHVPTYKLSPRNAVMCGQLAISGNTTHTITTKLLIAPFNNFCHTLQVQHSDPVAGETESLEKAISMTSFAI